MSREANGDLYGPWTDDEVAELIGDHDWVFYSGESDTPCEFEPLTRLADDDDVSDWTCSDHFYQQDITPDTWDEDDGSPEPVCDQCGETGWENGIQEFSWSSCHGCRSHLGGSRYRLAIHHK